MTALYDRDETLERLRGLGISTLPALPALEKRLVLRRADAVAHRANMHHMMYAIALRGPDSLPGFRDIIWSRKLARHLTRRERAWLLAGVASPGDLVDLSWRKEAAKALLWMGSVVDTPDIEDWGECDFSRYFPRIPPQRDMEGYLREFELRPLGEIVRELDLAYCLHWCAIHVPAELAAAPRPLLRSVIVERRRALEWATHRFAWENVPMDT